MGIINGAVWLAHVCVACSRFYYYDYYLRFVFGIKYVAVNYITYCEPKPKSIEQVNAIRYIVAIAIVVVLQTHHIYARLQRGRWWRRRRRPTFFFAMPFCVFSVPVGCSLFIYFVFIIILVAYSAAAATNRANE